VCVCIASKNSITPAPSCSASRIKPRARESAPAAEATAARAETAETLAGSGIESTRLELVADVSVCASSFLRRFNLERETEGTGEAAPTAEAVAKAAAALSGSGVASHMLELVDDV